MPSNRVRLRWAICERATLSKAIDCGQHVGPHRLAEQHIECRDICVPFDQGRAGADLAQRVGIERPDRRRDTRAVIVDQHDVPFDLVDGMAGEMDFANGVGGQRRR